MPENQGKEKEDNDSNVVLIGVKEPMKYVQAVIMQFNAGSEEVILKARGKAIVKAVDVSQRVSNEDTGFKPESSIGDIKIGTEDITGKDEEGNPKNIRVSSIEITIKK